MRKRARWPLPIPLLQVHPGCNVQGANEGGERRIEGETKKARGATRWSREGWQDRGKVGTRGWRSEFMAALSLYRPCRVSFSREEGRISRWTLALDSTALDERWASPLTFLFTRVSPERDYAYTCFLFHPSLGLPPLNQIRGNGNCLVTTRNRATWKNSFLDILISDVYYYLWIVDVCAFI